MKLGASQAFDPGLNAQVLIPDNAFEKRVDQSDDHGGGNQLRPELGAFCNATRDDGRYGRRESQQKEESDQLVAILGCQFFCAHQETGAVGDAVANHEIDDGGNRKVHQNLDQGVDLVLAAHGAEFQKCKTGMHGEHHDGAQK